MCMWKELLVGPWFLQGKDGAFCCVAKNSRLGNKAESREVQAAGFLPPSQIFLKICHYGYWEMKCNKKGSDSGGLKFSHIPPVFSAGFRFQMGMSHR